MNTPKIRSTLMALAGAYLLYLAYELFRDRNQPDTTMAPAVRIAFIAFFALAAVALMVYAWRIWKRGRDAGDGEEPPEDKDSLK